MPIGRKARRMRASPAEDSLMLTATLLKMPAFLASQTQSGGWSEAVADRQNWLPGAIAALGIAMITTVLLRRWLKRTRQARQTAATPIREQRERMQGRAERDSLDRLMVETGLDREAFASQEPMARFGNPREIGDAVVWLLSDQSSFVTGVAMPVDGGYTAI